MTTKKVNKVKDSDRMDHREKNLNGEIENIVDKNSTVVGESEGKTKGNEKGPDISKADTRSSVRKESENVVPNAINEASKFDEKTAVADGSLGAKALNPNSAAEKVDTPPMILEKSTLQEIIDSFTALSFMNFSEREVQIVSPEEIVKHLLGNDEFRFGECERVDEYFDVILDDPNRKYYVIRKSEHFLSWHELSGYYAAHLQLLERRKEMSLNVLREPPQVAIDADRVCNPEYLGYPSRHLLDGTVSDRVYRAALKSACKPMSINEAFVEIRCLGDGKVHEVNSKLIAYSRTVMRSQRDDCDRYLAVVAQVERKTKERISCYSAYDNIYPSFSPFGMNGFFDGLVKESPLRLHFSQSFVMPRIAFSPIPSGILYKLASISVTRTGLIPDVINRTWKPEYSESLWVYMLSLLMPGEIFINVVLPDTCVDLPIKGFSALIMRLTLMYSERTILSNSSRESQQAIDRAIVAWGIHAGVLEYIPDMALDEFPLNNCRLNSRAGAQAQRLFDFLKVRNGEAGMCANGCNYAKVDDELRRYYPNCCPRYNYAIDVDDYEKVRDSAFHMSNWRVYQGAIAFLSCSSQLNSVRSLFDVYARRIVEFIIRVNEYNRTNWYHSFRMTTSRASSYVGSVAQSRAASVDVSNEFFLVAGKGLDNSLLVSKYSPLEKLRMQSSFFKEAASVKLRFDLVQRLWRETGRLRSFPTTRRIKIACARSEIFNWVYTELFTGNEHKKMIDILNSFNFERNPLAEIFRPLIELSDLEERMYGIVSSVYVNSKLNCIGKQEVRSCIQRQVPFMNSAMEESNVAVYSYPEVENFVRDRRFNALIYNSVSRPFVLNIKFPYVIVTRLAGSENDKSILLASNPNCDVSYEYHVENGVLKIMILRVDSRDFQNEDDYVVATHRIDEMFPRSRDVDDIVIPAEHFFSTLGARTVKLIALTKKDHKFVSMYELSSDGLDNTHCG